MAGKFEIRKIDTGFVFRLKARNGEIIAVSEVYETLASCKNLKFMWIKRESIVLD